MRFTRRLCGIAGQTRPDDWAIFLNGHLIGRVLHYRLGPPGTERWNWSVQTYPGRGGSAPTLEEALANLKAAVLPLVVDGNLPMMGSRFGLFLSVESR